MKCPECCNDKVLSGPYYDRDHRTCLVCGHRWTEADKDIDYVPQLVAPEDIGRLGLTGARRNLPSRVKEGEEDQ